MEQPQFSTMATKFQSVLDANVLNERGKRLGLAKRERLMTPFRLGLSVVASMATQQVQTIADLHRQFNELWAFDTDYKAFYQQLLRRFPTKVLPRHRCVEGLSLIFHLINYASS